MVKLLIDCGADIFALSQGYSVCDGQAGGHDDIGEMLAPLMEEARKRDPNIGIRARIARLRREIASLESKL